MTSNQERIEIQHAFILRLLLPETAEKDDCPMEEESRLNTFDKLVEDSIAHVQEWE